MCEKGRRNKKKNLRTFSVLMKMINLKGKRAIVKELDRVAR